MTSWDVPEGWGTGGVGGGKSRATADMWDGGKLVVAEFTANSDDIRWIVSCHELAAEAGDGRPRSHRSTTYCQVAEFNLFPHP